MTAVSFLKRKSEAFECFKIYKELVKNMNHNLLSVGQMCDKGHTMLFNSTRCEIRKGRYGKIVATASQAPNDIYVLDEATKACILDKEYESW